MLILSVESTKQIMFKVLCMDIKNKYGLLFPMEHFYFVNVKYDYFSIT